MLSEQLTIQDVLFCPNAAMNLMSVSKLTELGLVVTFDNLKCTVKRGNDIILTGLKNDGLYIYKPTKRGLAFLTNVQTTRIDLVYARMGHINYQNLRRVAQISDGLVLDKSPETELCHSCIKAKSHRRHFSSSISHAKRFGELTHVDVCYVGIESVPNGFTHFVLFIDDATRFITAYLVKHKGDATECFKEYDAQVFNETLRHCQYLRSDNGTEFFNNTMNYYCTIHGIKQQPTTVYTPQGNSRAERPNRTCLEGTSAMLHYKDLNHEFWGWALLCFVYLKNRAPHSALHKITPYEARYQKLPDLSNVRIFGSKSYMHIPQEKRKGAGSKMLSKAKEVIFIGYRNHAGYFGIQKNVKQWRPPKSSFMKKKNPLEKHASD
jgi:transposase InsO family protein